MTTQPPSGVGTTAQKLWGLLTPADQVSAVILLSLMAFGMILEMAGVGLIVPVIAILSQHEFVTKYPEFQPVLRLLGNPNQQTLVIWAMLFLIALYLVKALFLAMLVIRQARFVFGIQAQLSQKLYSGYLLQPYTFHLQRNSTHLIRNVIGEVELLANTAIAPGLILVTELLVFGGLCSLLLFLEPLAASIIAMGLGFAAWGFHSATRQRLMVWGEARLHHDRMRMQHAQQGLASAKDVKLLGREANFLEKYAAHNVLATRAACFHHALTQLPRLWLELLATVALAILILAMVIQGREIGSILPTLGLFAAAAFRLLPSMNRIVGAIQTLRYGLPVIDLVHSELAQLTPKEPDTQVTRLPFSSQLEVDRVTYSYPGASQVALKNITFAINRGEMVGFIGTSGAGKSTLVDIILGLLRPDAGAIRVDGIDIMGSLRTWQNQIGYVPQSIYLTDDTLARNIGFGLPDQEIDESAVWRAIRAAQLEDLVDAQPEGLSMMVGERGVRLSGGQRQRIGIARALYHDPDVLILDEATSALDGSTEKGVMQAVRTLQGIKTILIVAHRLSTVENCDRLYRLEGGILVDSGKPVSMFSSEVFSAERITI